MSDEYIDYIRSRLISSLKTEGSPDNISQYDIEDFKTDDVNKLIESNDFEKFCKRCLRACKFYIRDNDISDPNSLILITKIDFLLIKMNLEMVYGIIYKNKYRVKDVLNKNVYEVNNELKKEREELLNKIVDSNVNSCSLYRCKRCGKKEHTYREVIARSLDEPPIVKCVCLVCGYKFNVG